jgi:predicted phosphodiesterase
VKLYVMSDLHLEDSQFVPPARTVAAADVVVLAGDIHPGADGIRWAAQSFDQKPLVYVAGNHEYWQGDWDLTLTDMRQVAKQCGVHFLENDSLVIPGLEAVRFLGCSLWTDFEYFGVDRKNEAMQSVRTYLPDYDYVTVRGGQEFLTPEHTVARHKESLAWLEAELAKDFHGSTVVVTHHFPHKKSSHPAYAHSLTTAAYGSKLTEDLLRRANLWVHGHTHHSNNYRIGDSKRNVRVISNPRGVPHWDGNHENQNFNPHLLVEQIIDGNWAEYVDLSKL